MPTLLPMTTLTRLSFWLAPERLDEFPAYFSRRLVPLLTQQGLADPTPCPRAQPPHIFSQLFALESPSQVKQHQKQLNADPSWKGAMAGWSSRWRLGVYSAPATGKVVEAGSGFHQGGWHCFTVQDGLPSSLIVQILQDQQGRLWLRTHDEGGCCYDGQQFRTFTAEDGLADNEVTFILEDRQGSLWFATQKGLCRYDGQGFEVFTVEDGLADSAVVSMLEDRQGHLWCRTQDGQVCCFDGRQFTRFTAAGCELEGLAVHSMLADTKGNLWFATQREGVICCEGRDFKPPAEGLPHSVISSMVEDRSGNLWFSTGAGLSRYDGRQFKTFTAAEGLPADHATLVLVDRGGKVWLATAQGLGFYDGQQFTALAAESRGVRGGINGVLEDRQGNLWFATQGGGIWRYDGQQFSIFTPRDGLGHNRAWGTCEDRQGNLWFGTWGGGLNRYDGGHLTSFTREEGLAGEEVEDICQDRQGNLWFATRDGGASCFDGRRFKNYTTREGLAADFLWTVCEDRQGRLWFGTNEAGVSCFDGEHFRTYTTEHGLAHDNVWCICQDREGNLWFTTRDGGVSCFDGEHFRSFRAQDGLAHDRVWCVCQDRQRNLWFGTWSGVSRFDGEHFRTYTTEHGLAHDNVWCTLEDREGNLWFGTWGGGVSRFDGEQFTTFTKQDGLADNNVRSIFQSRDGHLWFGTYGGGVSRFDGQVFQSLSRKDGLVHDAVQKVLQDRDGHMWIATEGGVTRYIPVASPPMVKLRGVVADRRYGPEGPTAISVSQKLVGFEFQGSSFTTAPRRMAYVYRLVGYEEDWRTTYQRRVEYNDLPVGTYTFQVRAVDRDLNYSEALSVQLVVEPNPQQDRIQALASELSQPQGLEQFIGNSRTLRNAIEQLRAVAQTEMTVLILGETGTGKGLGARAIHQLSRRQGGPFIQVNCGAIPEGLVESELFGHEKGAFTGAVARRVGRFELADRGTLLLDEVGDLPLEAQQVLLQVLQEGTLQRVGGHQVIEVDVRVIAATNRDLRSAMAQGRFREDLFFRLSAFVLPLPPLRQRQEDIGLLVHHFAERFARHLNRPVPRIEAQVLRYLENYAWPGNVRELEHLVQRAVLLCEDNHIRLADVPLWGAALSPATPARPLTREPQDLCALDDHLARSQSRTQEEERRLIQQALEACNWIVYGPRGAAQLLGIHPERLRRLMRKLGLQRPRL
ncbi:MAG: sigma 54-interacting transcriptional regulator [Candidatus Latescibacteria bacterium]|nr:sigma 54-interacting transcriptional regulator [Candidatus Latescibacterota bacterium]